MTLKVKTFKPEGKPVLSKEYFNIFNVLFNFEHISLESEWSRSPSYLKNLVKRIVARWSCDSVVPHDIVFGVIHGVL